jgi:hypothetical protein
VIVRIPVLHHVNDAEVMNHSSHDDANVEQLVACEPDIEFAWPETLGDSKPIYQHADNIGYAHTEQIAEGDGIERKG